MAQSQTHSEFLLSSSWQARLRYWESALADNPDSPVAWRWRIQIKILRFMLSRYSDFERVPILPEASPTITVFDVPPHPTPPKSDVTLRRSLFRVAKTNGFKPHHIQNPADWPLPKTQGLSPAEKVEWPTPKIRGLSPAEKFVFAVLTKVIYQSRLPRRVSWFCFVLLQVLQTFFFILPLLFLCLCALLVFICSKLFL